MIQCAVMPTRKLFSFFFLVFLFVKGTALKAQESTFEVQVSLTEDCSLIYYISKSEGSWKKEFELQDYHLEEMKEELEIIQAMTSHPEVVESLERMKATAIGGGTGYFFAELSSMLKGLHKIVRARFVAITTIASAIVGYAFETQEQREEKKSNTLRKNFPGFFPTLEVEELRADLENSLTYLAEKKEKDSCENYLESSKVVNGKYINLFQLLISPHT